MGVMESLRAERFADGLRMPGPGAALMRAADFGLAGVAAHDLAQAGWDVLLLHSPADEAPALSVALRVEGEGRRCELVAGALDDEETCEEAALHAAFLGRGRIGALVCVDGPTTAPAVGMAGLDALLRAVVPLMAPDARVVHIQPELPRDAGREALSAQRMLHHSAQRMLGRLRREHGLHDLRMTVAAGWAWAAEGHGGGLDGGTWAPSSG